MTWTTRPRSDFGTLKAIKEGDGLPLLLLHGVGLRAEAWNLQISALKSEYSICAPDMPGHGLSRPNENLNTLDAFTDHIAKQLNEAVLVAGHSMGAMLALNLAIRFPQKVLGLVALNAIYRRSAQAKEAVQARASAFVSNQPVDPTPTLTRWFKTLESPEAIACKQWLSDVNKDGYKQAYTIFATEDGPAKEALEKLPMPALFMTGEEEPNSTPAMSKEMASLAPHGRAMIVSDAAHMMPMTHGETVNAALVDFFKECA